MLEVINSLRFPFYVNISQGPDTYLCSSHQRWHDDLGVGFGRDVLLPAPHQRRRDDRT